METIRGCVTAQPQSLLLGKTAGGFLDERIAIEQKQLNLYLIDIKYIQNPAKADDHVMLRNMLCH